MASQNKKNKLKNSYQCKSGLKAKDKGIKGMTFYTSSERNSEKNELPDTFWEEWEAHAGKRLMHWMCFQR